MSASTAASGQCSHLDQVQPVEPRTPDGCEECLEVGDPWVHLRLCLTCGHVGCCDESKNRHATHHFRSTEHPLIRSFEPGEEWIWCYLDRVSFGPRDSGVTREVLQRQALFAGLSEEDLARLYQMARVVFYPSGQVVFEEGEPGDALYIVLDGELEISKRGEKGQAIVLAVRGPGEFVGEMALLEDAPRTATVRATRESRLLVISQQAFQTLLECDPSVHLRILRTVTSRLRSTEALLRQQEQLAALGRFSAGIMHELNNPAAAVARGASQLRDALEQVERSAAELGAAGIDRAQLAALDALRGVGAADRPPDLNPLARSDREDEVQDWLDERGVDRAWENAPALVARGWDRACLDRAAQRVSPAQLPALVQWLAAGASAHALLEEVAAGAQEISQIVRAAKAHAYTDQAPVQLVDVHQSLDATLIILRHKLGQDVQVVREYADDLPRVEGYGSELSQVWRNLVDNAIDALGGRGEIVIRTRAEDETVVVEVQDDGPGISPEHLPRIFEPFYTTKEVGKGTGLGLHLAYTTVVDRHRGTIEAHSEPGRTCFRVRLPVQLRRP